MYCLPMCCSYRLNTEQAVCEKGVMKWHRLGLGGAVIGPETERARKESAWQYNPVGCTSAKDYHGRMPYHRMGANDHVGNLQPQNVLLAGSHRRVSVRFVRSTQGIEITNPFAGEYE
jgi:hypothetical protein